MPAIYEHKHSPSPPAVSTPTFTMYCHCAKHDWHVRSTGVNHSSVCCCGWWCCTYWTPVQSCPWGTPFSLPPRAPAACFVALPYEWAAWCPLHLREHWRTCTPPAASRPAERITESSWGCFNDQIEVSLEKGRAAGSQWARLPLSWEVICHINVLVSELQSCFQATSVTSQTSCFTLQS